MTFPLEKLESFKFTALLKHHFWGCYCADIIIGTRDLFADAALGELLAMSGVNFEKAVSRKTKLPMPGTWAAWQISSENVDQVKRFLSQFGDSSKLDSLERSIDSGIECHFEYIKPPQSTETNEIQTELKLS